MRTLFVERYILQFSLPMESHRYLKNRLHGLYVADIALLFAIENVGIEVLARYKVIGQYNISWHSSKDSCVPHSLARCDVQPRLQSD